MRRIISMILVAIIAASSCCLLSACVGYTKTIRYDDVDKYLIGSQTYENADIDELRIDWPDGQVVLVEDPNATCVTVAEENNLDDKRKVHSYYHDGILDIKFWQSGLHGYVLEKDKHLTVTYRSVRNLVVNVASSTLKATELHVENADIEMTSGDIDVDGITCNKLTCTMTSGDIDINKIDCNVFILNMTSGNACFAEITATQASMSQSSGDITARALNVDTFRSNSTSGDLEASFVRANHIDIVLTSGDVEIGIPDEGATVAVASTSGRFKSNLSYSINQGRYVFGEGKCDIGIEMTSGSAWIKNCVNNE